VYGVPLPGLPEEHVTVPDQRDRRRREGIRTHVAATGTPGVVVAGVPVSGTVRMFVQLAELLHLVDLVGDPLVGVTLVTPEALREFCAASSARPGREAGATWRHASDTPEPVPQRGPDLRFRHDAESGAGKVLRGLASVGAST
jgi:hypothetical protein